MCFHGKSKGNLSVGGFVSFFFLLGDGSVIFLVGNPVSYHSLLTLPASVQINKLKKKKCYDCSADYGWSTWQRRNLNDFWWVGNTKPTFVNLMPVKVTFPQNFVINERSRTSFLPVLHVTNNCACKQTNLYSSLFLFSNLKLSISRVV